MTLELLEFYTYATPTYQNFISFVERYLAPQMGMRFVVEDYYETLWNANWSQQFVDAQISRGHSKSELFGVWMTIYIAAYQPFNPHYERVWGQKKRIIEQLVVSSDYNSTGEMARRIKEAIQFAPDLQHLLPSMRDEKKWNSELIQLTNGSVIHFRSIKLKRGLHVDRIVCDDLTTESSTLSDDETWSFFTGALLPMGTAKQAMVMVDGTPIRATDIMGRLSRDENWHHIKLPAISDVTTQRVLSPKRFTWNMLMDVKKRIGPVKFEAEYMLNPIDDTVSLIKRQWVQQCFSSSTSLSRTRGRAAETYLGVDFAFSDRKDSDWSVFYILGVVDDKFVQLDYIRRRGMSGQEQLAFIRELHTVYKFDSIGLEANSIQAIVPDVRNMGLPVKLFNTGNVDERDKLKPDFSRIISVSKRNLVLRLGTTFENHGIIIPYRDEEAKAKADQLLEECVSWAQEEGKLIELGVHPDVPIALGYALEVATKNNVVIDIALM